MFRRSNPCGNPDDHILKVQVLVTLFPEPAAMLLFDPVFLGLA
jgi:hypothetical protein